MGTRYKSPINLTGNPEFSKSGDKEALIQTVRTMGFRH
jgi:hypothetical protein